MPVPFVAYGRCVDFPPKSNMAWKFLNIAKANAEIDRLNADLAAVTKERDDLKAAAEANTSEVGKHAEELAAKLTETESKLAKALEDGKAASATLATQATDISGLKDQLKAKDAEVEAKVARKLAEAQAALGQPDKPSIPASGKAPNISELHGLQKVIAIEKAETAAAKAQTKN